MPMSEAAAEFGTWLARERGKRSVRGKPLSTTQLANFTNVYIKVKKLPVKSIHQQEISRLENAANDPKAPKRPAPWWGVLRQFIESGALDELVDASNIRLTNEHASVVVDLNLFKAAKSNTVVRTPDGEIVGEIIWHKK